MKKSDHTKSLDDILLRNHKGEVFYIWLLVLWVSCLLYFNPRLLALTYAAPNLISKTAVIVFTVCLDIFWLYTIYHTLMIGFSIWVRKKLKSQKLPPSTNEPAVAVLYPTRNDFCTDSVLSCLNQEYKNFHLFILDDGTVEKIKQSIDGWARQYPDKVTVIRRPEKGGYKAGNLNYGLKQIKNNYPYFAVCDADGILPKNFIKDLLPFTENKNIAYVQACQEGNPNQKKNFGRILNHMVVAHYKYYVEAKNYFGFVMFYGHGGLLKTSVWEEVGGFPEIATEDLAYSAKVREFGYQGIYTDQVICYEDFPPSLAQLRKRSEKWIRGTSEFLKLHYGSFLKSKKVSWYEKLDVAIGSFSHYQSVFMLIFLLMLGTLLPAYFDHFRYPGSFFLTPVPYGKSIGEYLIHIRYHIFWSLDFYAVMMLTIMCPVIPAIIDLRKKPKKLLPYLAVSNFVFLSSLVVEVWDCVIFLITREAVFRNTMDAESNDKERRVKFFHPNHWIVWLSEIVMGGILFLMGITTKNFWFMAPAAALFLTPLICRWGWEQRALRFLSCIPVVITLIILVLVSLDLVMMLVA